MKNSLLLAVFLTAFSAIRAQHKNEKTDTIKVYGTCGQCKHRIEASLKTSPVYKANWDLETKWLKVSYDSLRLSRSKIEKKIAAAGHDTEDYQASDEMYHSLPKCCYYDRYKKAATSAAAADSVIQLTDSSLHTITGVILREDSRGKLWPLPNATVIPYGTRKAALSDSLGVFQLLLRIPARLIISYTGFAPDTFEIRSSSEIKIILKNGSTTTLSSVVVRAKNPSTYISALSTMNTLNIGSKELSKAACCNLSESFETSPSVDLSYSDAVTGIKQIQLLGLQGSYSQILTENIPALRGLPGSFGLGFIPGTWIEGIQITKGAGSVANGYESIAGQINIEEKKPDNDKRFEGNAYINSMGRAEASVNLAKKLDDKWMSALLIHGNGVFVKNDANHDGFLDIPVGGQLNVLNRWKYTNNNGIMAQFSVNGLIDHRQAGQLDFNPSRDKFTTNYYGVGIDVSQLNMTGKIGYVFPEQRYKSIGLILSQTVYDNTSYYGLTSYSGDQRSFYANLIYQSIIGSTIHKFRMGMSLANDGYRENFDTAIFRRKETVPGIFTEYTFTPNEKFSIIAGLRVDHHNEYGFITTPRLHIKYNLGSGTTLRVSAGSGFKVANIFAENAGLWASSRQYKIVDPSNNYGYGLNPERAWNYGFNFTQAFKISKRKASAAIDIYRTDFRKQVIVDIDASPQQVLFYNLNGRSYSNSVQMQLDFEPVQKFELRFAYRWLDVYQDYGGKMLEKPLVARNRAFVNLAYTLASAYKFDLTGQYFGRKRLPSTASNPVEYRLPDYSPGYFQMNAQVTRIFRNEWSVYLGAENLTNYIQKKLFIAGDQPFSRYFDGSIVWGPINGALVYIGIRHSIQ